MSARTMHRSDPRAARFADYRRAGETYTAFRSAQSERLEL